MKNIKVENYTIGDGEKPFIIAEMSGNHNQSLDKALALVDAAAEAGVHALKIQTYTADTMTLNIKRPGFVVDDKKSLWNGETLYGLYEKAYTPWEWHKPIFDRCKEHGMIGFSSPFDKTAVDFLEELDVPLYKVASFEFTDFPLIKRIAQTKKPMILSTGMATIKEIDETVSLLRSCGHENFILLKCTSTYPASPENTNISTVANIRETFNCHAGLSDHTLGIGVSVASVAFGARVIEKHFTIDRSEGGVDSAFSLEPHELKALVDETERAHLAIGKVSYGPTNPEKNSMIFRRTVYVSEDIQAGEVLNEKNVRCIRPGFGLATKHYEDVIGKQAKRDLKIGDPLSWDMID